MEKIIIKTVSFEISTLNIMGLNFGLLQMTSLANKENS